MNQELKTFIEQHTAKIESNDWIYLYHILAQNEKYIYLRKNDLLTPADFTQCLAESGINPLLSMKYVPEYFLYKSNVTKIELPENIEGIAPTAFYACKQLVDINLNNIKSIGDQAFYNCKNLNKVELKYNIRIYSRAFTNTEIKDLYIPERFSPRTSIDCFDGAKIKNLFYDGTENLFEDMEMFFRDSKIEDIKYLK